MRHQAGQGVYRVLRPRWQCTRRRDPCERVPARRGATCQGGDGVLALPDA